MRGHARQGPLDIREQTVLITGVDYATGRLMVRDIFNREFEVDGSIVPKGMGMPDEGETWVIERKSARWVLAYQVGRRGIPTIEGERRGMNPVAEQMLDALIHHGLVLDQTTPRPLPLALDDISDPSIPPPPDPDPSIDDGSLEDSEDLDPANDDSASAPPDDNGPQHPDSQDSHPDGWLPVYLGTYNMKFTMGPQRASRDIARLTASKLDVVGLQECTRADRNQVMARAQDLGWSVYRPSVTNSEAVPILWRTDEFVHLDDGTFVMSPQKSTSDGPLPARHLNWVKLRHKASHREFYFTNGHLLAHIEGHGSPPGHPSTAPSLSNHVSTAFEEIDVIRQKVNEFGSKAPTFYVGDTNINYFADRAVRHPQFLYRNLTSIGAVCNWGELHRPSYGTHGNRFIDQLWTVRPVANQIRFSDHWILTGYNSDHRPVMVKMLFKTKASGGK